MESRAKLFGHAIHPVMIVFPLGLLSTSVVFDVIYLIWGNPNMSLVAYYMLAAGIIGGFLAAPFGTIDWLAIPSGTRAKTIGLMHGGANVVALLVFIGSWYFRTYTTNDTLPYLLSFAGLFLSLLGGWLGGELVERLGVGVDDGAHLNAPNSLTNDSPAQNAYRASSNV